MNQDFAVIFDMDGVLLDTEPLWGESMMTVAKSHGIEISYADLRYTTGLRIHEVTAFWSVRFPWQGATSSDAIAEDILDHIIDSAKRNASVMSGVIHQLDYLRSQQIQIGVATSSPFRMADELIRHFGIYDYFQEISTGDEVTLGKPHPEVYLKCAKGLSVNSYQCIAVEDSINGMIAAKAARMKVVAIPEYSKLEHPAFGLADLLLPSMQEMPSLSWQAIANN